MRLLRCIFRFWNPLINSIHNPLKIAFHYCFDVFKDAFSAKNTFLKKFNYFIKPPGWKHDGSGLLSEDLRKEWLMNQQINADIKQN